MRVKMALRWKTVVGVLGLGVVAAGLEFWLDASRVEVLVVRTVGVFIVATAVALLAAAAWLLDTEGLDERAQALRGVRVHAVVWFGILLVSVVVDGAEVLLPGVPVPDAEKWRAMVVAMLVVQAGLGIALVVESVRAARRQEWGRMVVWAIPCVIVVAATALVWRAVP